MGTETADGFIPLTSQRFLSFLSWRKFLLWNVRWAVVVYALLVLSITRPYVLHYLSFEDQQIPGLCVSVPPRETACLSLC